MPVQTENAEAPVVQEEPVDFKPGIAKADPSVIFVELFTLGREYNFHLVQVRRVHIPELDVGQF